MSSKEPPSSSSPREAGSTGSIRSEAAGLSNSPVTSPSSSKAPKRPESLTLSPRKSRDAGDKWLPNFAASHDSGRSPSPFPAGFAGASTSCLAVGLLLCLTRMLERLPSRTSSNSRSSSGSIRISANGVTASVTVKSMCSINLSDLIGLLAMIFWYMDNSCRLVYRCTLGENPGVPSPPLARAGPPTLYLSKKPLLRSNFPIPGAFTGAPMLTPRPRPAEKPVGTALSLPPERHVLQSLLFGSEPNSRSSRAFDLSTDGSAFQEPLGLRAGISSLGLPQRSLEAVLGSVGPQRS
mmetsp:Transcript_12408/g.45219  ORF Transcript_12408/g.45219 Transcript_12408/m.45219 type:complete len:294 (+) Transcript_12408:4069-4950(+)